MQLGIGDAHADDNISARWRFNAPHRAIHSYKEMLVHLALVTLGVLIALSFEGVASWREHRRWSAKRART